MKGKDIIRIIQSNHLESFDLEFVLTEVNELGIHVRTFNIEELCDIGHSSNVVSFDGEEK